MAPASGSVLVLPTVPPVPVLTNVKLSGIRAITFDAAGTLVDPHPSVGAVYAEIGRAHGLPVADDELERRFRVVFKARRLHARTDEAGERTFWRGLAGEVFAPWADAATMDRLYPDLWETFAEARRWRPRAELEPLFTELCARGLRLAVLSNWDSRLHRVIDGHGWRRWLAGGVFISSEIGVEKPDRALFAHAAAALGCSPGELLHVGDSWEHDIAGALAAGWHAAWLSKTDTPLVDARAQRIRALAEVPGLLG